jgi:hypothetical protein
MKQAKLIILSSISFMALMTIVLTSCNNNGDVVYGPTTFYKPCEKVYCINGGACHDGLCKCPVGFEGTTCELRSSDRFVGNYKTYDACYTGQLDYYNATITANAQEASQLVLGNLGSFCTNAFPLNAYLDATGTGFTIPMQKSCDDLYISGNGNINNEILNVFLTARDSVNHTSTNCSVVMNKQ